MPSSSTHLTTPDTEERNTERTYPTSVGTNRGTLLGIAVRAASRAPMEVLSSARISTDHGVGTDFRGKPGRRQVTVLTSSGWRAACSALSTDLSWTTRRANLFVEGLDLKGKTGYELRIGEAILIITGETRPCQRMDELCPGLLEVLRPDWRAGVTTQVVRGANVSLGAAVLLDRNVMRYMSVRLRNWVRRNWRRSRQALSRTLRRHVVKVHPTGQ